jgi:hypothetical protein
VFLVATKHFLRLDSPVWRFWSAFFCFFFAIKSHNGATAWLQKCLCPGS